MGVGQSSTNKLAQCLLSPQDFKNLRVGSKLDHRDTEGRFCPAVVKSKFKNGLEIHYEGWGSKYDTKVNYNNQTAMDFAQYKSVSCRPAQGPLAKYSQGDYIMFDVNGQWKQGRIIEMDDMNGESGQVKVQCGNLKRWTHLDNELEIKSMDEYSSTNTQQPEQKWHNNTNNNNRRNQYNNRGRGGYGGGQYQQQSQTQIKRQDQMTVRTQLLIDDTNKQIKLTKNYLNAVMNENGKYTKDEISIYNQKVVVGLTCFKMKVNGMRKNAQKEKINFKDAFKASAQIIREFEVEFTAQFGGNKYLMQRLNPCLNYMKAVLQGKKTIPKLPYINDYEFDKQTASSVISAVTHAQNHVIPDRMKEVNDNNEHYKKNQKRLSQKFDQSDRKENINEVEVNGLIQDYNSPNIAYAMSKKDQERMHQQQTRDYQHKEPIDMLMGNTGCDHTGNGHTGNESDIGNSDEDNDQCMAGN